MKKTIVLGILVMFAAVSSRADEACMNENESTLGMKMCLGEDLQKAEIELNSTYKEVLKKNKDQKEFLRRLVASQKAWMIFKEADCSLQSTEMLGGTGEGLVLVSCLVTKTQERVDALKSYLNEIH